MTCTINWNTLSIEEWEERFARVPRSNLLQSYTYARAHCPHAKVRARWGAITLGGREAGIVQIFESGFFRNIIHGVMVDRGPLWFEGFGSAIHIKLFFDELNRQFPQRFARKRRFLPEIEDGPTARALIAQTGLIRLQDRTGYQTIWLDLTRSEEDLRAALKSNWRGHLSKVEKSGLRVYWDKTGVSLSHILPVYTADKAARDYGGPAPDFLKSYGTLLAAKGDLFIGHALPPEGTGTGDPLAFVVIVRHGRSATYFVGWSSQSGRENSAHHLLLWDAVKMLQTESIREFDLGGINDDGQAKGLRHFKEGLGGRAVRYVGHYV